MKERSSSLLSLDYALRAAREAGAETARFDVRALDLPMFVPGREAPAAARAWAEAVHGAQGLLWSAPMYHGTISGSFKNTLDWLELLSKREPPYLAGKVVGLISSAGGVQGLQAINTLEYVVRALRGWTVPLVVPVPRGFDAFDAAGEPKDPKIAAQLRGVAREVVQGAKLLGATSAR